MRRIVGFFAIVLTVATVAAFVWRAFVIVGAPIAGYSFGEVFNNTAWGFGLIYGLYKIMPKPGEHA